MTLQWNTDFGATAVAHAVLLSCPDARNARRGRRLSFHCHDLEEMR